MCGCGHNHEHKHEGGCACHSHKGLAPDVEKLNRELAKVTKILSVIEDEDNGYILFDSSLQEDSYSTKDYEHMELYVAGFVLGRTLMG